MIEGNDSLIRMETRKLLISMLRRGQLKEAAHQTQQALLIWLEALRGARDVVGECRLQLNRRRDGTESMATLSQSTPAGEAIRDLAISTEYRDKNSLTDGELNDSTQENVKACRQRLRAALEVEHMCIFFIANACYQLKCQAVDALASPAEVECLERTELENYELARQIRKEVHFVGSSNSDVNG